MSRQFRVPQSIRFGQGASLAVAEEALALGGTRALLVTDQYMQQSGATAPVLNALKQAGIKTEVYDGVNSEPDLDHVSQALEIQQKNGCDIMVSFGGGSPLDAAKAVSIMATNPGHISDYMGVGNVKKDGLPMIAIPTTAGTGSEGTQVTIITDTSRDVKMMISSPQILPKAALVDPDLTLAMPKGLTAATGLDALTHAIEAYVSVKAQPMSDMFALNATRLLGQYLLKSWQNPNDYEARSNTLLGALQAGIAFSNSSVALVHGMSRPIGALFHVAHGVSNATLLKVVMEFSLPGNLQRYSDLAIAMGLEDTGNIEKNAQAGMDRVAELVQIMEVPSCTALGVTKEKLDQYASKMAEDAIASGSPGNNPRQASKQEIVELYYKAL